VNNRPNGENSSYLFTLPASTVLSTARVTRLEEFSPKNLPKENNRVFFGQIFRPALFNGKVYALISSKTVLGYILGKNFFATF
jgi:hypothetical protein